MSEVNLPIVLLVEDEPLVREIAAIALSDAGVEVIEAASGDGALEVLNGRSDIRVVFTDINMPGRLDGLDLARLVNERWPAVQVALTSGRPLSGSPPDGVDRFMAKPYQLDEMIQVVKDLIGRSD